MAGARVSPLSLLVSCPWRGPRAAQGSPLLHLPPDFPGSPRGLGPVVGVGAEGQACLPWSPGGGLEPRGWPGACGLEVRRQAHGGPGFVPAGGTPEGEAH